MMWQRSNSLILIIMICTMAGSAIASELPRYRSIWLRHADTTVWITRNMDVTDHGTIVYEGVLRLSDNTPLGSANMNVTVYKNGHFVCRQTIWTDLSKKLSHRF